MAAALRIIFLASQWAFGSILERWFGGDDSKQTGTERLITKALIYGVGAFVVITLVRMFAGKRKWNTL